MIGIANCEFEEGRYGRGGGGETEPAISKFEMGIAISQERRGAEGQRRTGDKETRGQGDQETGGEGASGKRRNG